MRLLFLNSLVVWMVVVGWSAFVPASAAEPQLITTPDKLHSNLSNVELDFLEYLGSLEEDEAGGLFCIGAHNNAISNDATQHAQGAKNPSKTLGKTTAKTTVSVPLKSEGSKPAVNTDK